VVRVLLFHRPVAPLHEFKLSKDGTSVDPTLQESSNRREGSEVDVVHMSPFRQIKGEANEQTLVVARLLVDLCEEAMRV
jgi:hypothetical protein